MSRFEHRLIERMQIGEGSSAIGTVTLTVDAPRGRFDGDVAVVRYVADSTPSTRGDNCFAIAQALRTIAETLDASLGLDLGRAQICVIVERRKAEPEAPTKAPPVRLTHNADPYGAERTRPQKRAARKRGST